MQISYSSHTCVQLDMRSTTAIIPQHHMHIIIPVTNHYIIVYISISYNNHAPHYKYPIHHISTPLNINVPSVVSHTDGLGIYVLISDSVEVEILLHSDVLTRCQPLSYSTVR